MIFIYLWRFLSYDYTALADLIHGEEIFGIFKLHKYLLNLVSHTFFASSTTIHALQLFAGFLLLISAWKLKRIYIFLALIIPFIFESGAFLYRFQLYDSDFSMALLGIVVLYPFNLKTSLTGGKEVSKSATQLGFLLAAYCGGSYFLAGLSKLQVPNWWNEVHLELLYPAIEVWHGIQLPWWLDPIAFKIHRFLTDHQTLTAIGALVSLCAELGWILCLFFRWARFLFPPLMLSVHLGIFFSSGLLFFSMGACAFLSVIPYRDLFKSQSLKNEAQTHNFQPFVLKKLFLPLIFIISLLIIPIYRPYIYPFANYYNFGWSYAKISSPGVIYRLGFFNPELKVVQQIPMNYGGFFDYRHISLSAVEVKEFLNVNSDEKKIESKKRLVQYIDAFRDPNSNNWLLGNLSYPPHFFAKTEQFPMHYFDKLFLLEGQHRLENGKIEIVWTNHGEFEY